VAFKLDVTGDTGNKVKSALADILTGMGFTVSDTDVNAVPVKVQVSFEDVELNQPQKFTRYTLALNVFNQAGDDIITLTDSGREGHITQSEAQARALRTVINKLKTELPKRLNKYFDAMVTGKQ